MSTFLISVSIWLCALTIRDWLINYINSLYLELMGPSCYIQDSVARNLLEGRSVLNETLYKTFIQSRINVVIATEGLPLNGKGVTKHKVMRPVENWLNQQVFEGKVPPSVAQKFMADIDAVWQSEYAGTSMAAHHVPNFSD